MGIIQSAGNVWGKGKDTRKKKWNYLESQADARINSLNRSIDFRHTEDPREQAHNKQSLFGRGLGLSTIAQQDTGRLTQIQNNRNAALLEQYNLALQYRKYLSAQKEYERRQAYAALADDVLNIYTAGMSGGGEEADQQTQSYDGWTSSNGNTQTSTNDYEQYNYYNNNDDQ